MGFFSQPFGRAAKRPPACAERFMRRAKGLGRQGITLTGEAPPPPRRVQWASGRSPRMPLFPRESAASPPRAITGEASWTWPTGNLSLL